MNFLKLILTLSSFSLIQASKPLDSKLTAHNLSMQHTYETGKAALIAAGGRWLAHQMIDSNCMGVQSSRLKIIKSVITGLCCFAFLRSEQKYNIEIYSDKDLMQQMAQTDSKNPTSTK